MDLTDWLLIPLSTLTVVSILLLVILGGTVAFPERWENELWQAARDEVERRFAGFGPRSQYELIAAARLVGPKPAPAEPSHEATDRILSTTLILTNRSDRARVDDELATLRARLQASALTRQVQLVSKVASIRVASYLWRSCDWGNRGMFAIAGLVWFFPKSLPYLSESLQKNSGALAVSGIIAGILGALLTRAMAPGDAAFDWLGFIGDVAMIFALAGIVIAVLGLYKAVLISQFGAPHQWTLRGVIAGISFFLYAAIVVGLETSGLLTQWQRGAVLWAQEIDITEDDAARWAGGVVLVAFIVYLLRNCYRWIRMSGLMLSDRLWAAAGTPLVLLMLVLIVLFTLNVPIAGLGWLFASTALILLILGGIASVTASVEWIQKCRVLRAMGHRVPRKGFRWWALIAWAASAVALTVLWPHLTERTANPSVVAPLAMLLNLATAVWSLAFFPGAIVTVLYVRRVAKEYGTVRFKLAPPHILLSCQRARR